MAARYGAEAPVLDWRERLVCSRRGSRRVDIVARVKCARGPLLPPRIMSGRPSIAHLSLLRQPRGGPSGPQCLRPPVHGRDRLIGEGSYGAS